MKNVPTKKEEMAGNQEEPAKVSEAKKEVMAENQEESAEVPTAKLASFIIDIRDGGTFIFYATDGSNHTGTTYRLSHEKVYSLTLLGDVLGKISHMVSHKPKPLDAIEVNVNGTEIIP